MDGDDETAMDHDTTTTWSVQGDAVVDGSTSASPQNESLVIRQGAKALVRDDDEVLLVTERRDDGSTFCTLPGGGVEAGESRQECLQREYREELNCQVDVGPPIGTCLYHHQTLPNTATVYTVFEATPAGRPRPNPREDVVACHWQDPNAPPAETLEPFQRVLANISE
jgi:8-oxo-dGTP diphosphatase